MKPPESPLPPPIPGVDRYAQGVGEAVGDWSWGTEEQPRQTKAKPQMTPFAQEIANRVKETFYHYVNRKTEDNRGAQTTLGPSEIGHPCDRRLAMRLMSIPAVNPPRYDWAAFIGTAVHASLSDMFLWANAGGGRYDTEVPLTYCSLHVPGGTADLVDRVLYLSIDHKVLGSWSLNQFRAEGPPAHYRVQIHTYALGLKSRGEVIRKVAIIVWPRERSSLDDLWVWEEDYDPAIGRGALERVDGIAERLERVRSTTERPDLIARHFPIDNADCKFCPFHRAGSTDLRNGCNGRT